MREFLCGQTGDIVLDKPKLKFCLQHARDLFDDADFFRKHAEHTVTLDDSEDTDVLSEILDDRGLELTDNGNGTVSFTAAFVLLDLNCGFMPAIRLNKNTRERGRTVE